MANRSWNFDGTAVQSSEGGVVTWENDTFFTIDHHGKIYHGEILMEDTESNLLRIKVNHRVFEVSKKGSLDALISELGMDVPKVRKLKELQAPMPGRIIQFAVKVGDELQVGDEILSLEAMKMENVLKAEGIGVVKAILAKPDQVVEKGAVIIEFE